MIQQALPVRYAVMPLLTAYWVMDLESMERGEEPVGLFNRALAFWHWRCGWGRAGAFQTASACFM